MSAFPAVVKFFAFDLPGRGGESPNSALLIVQLLACLLAELFAGDEFRHEVHILSSMAVAEILTSMYEEIKALEVEREKMIQIREGAMDDLLTGRVRLSV